jgi:hypothetical protein
MDQQFQMSESQCFDKELMLNAMKGQTANRVGENKKLDIRKLIF